MDWPYFMTPIKWFLRQTPLLMQRGGLSDTSRFSEFTILCLQTDSGKDAMRGYRSESEEPRGPLAHWGAHCPHFPGLIHCIFKMRSWMRWLPRSLLPLDSRTWGFPGGPVVKNLPANAGDRLDPWSWRIPHAAEQLRPFVTTTETTLGPRSRSYWAHVLQLLKPMCPRACAPQQGKPQQWEACTQQLESNSRSLQKEKSPHSNEDLAQPKMHK